MKQYCLLIPMLYCDAIVDAMVKGLGQQTASVRYNILTSVMDVAGLYVLLPRYGMQGYFVSFLITHLINFALSLRRLVIISRIRIPFSGPVFAITAAVLSLSGAVIISGIPWRIIVFGALWGSLLVLFGIISRQDIRWVKGLITKK